MIESTRTRKRRISLEQNLAAIAIIAIAGAVLSSPSFWAAQAPKALSQAPPSQPSQPAPTSPPSPSAAPSPPSPTAPPSQPSQPAPTSPPLVENGKRFLNQFFTFGAGSNIPNRPVRLDGREIFSVAIAIEDRAATIEEQLQSIVKSEFAPETGQIYYQILNHQPVLYVEGASQNEPITILTVTTLDTKLYGGIDAETLAKQWQEKIRKALTEAKQERQPEFIKQQAVLAAGILLGTIVVSVTLSDWQQRLKKRHQQIVAATPPPIEKNIPDPEAQTPESASGSQEVSESIVAFKDSMAQDQKRNMNEIQQGLLSGARAIAWSGGLYINLGLFAQTRWLQPLILSFLSLPLKVLGVGFATYLAIRLSSVTIDRFFAALQEGAIARASSYSLRGALRFSTFAKVVKNLARGASVTIGILVALSVIGIDIGPIIAGAGLIGLGISLASQSLIKDMINGFLILLEDQYAVGDVISVGSATGLVEDMNLRMTQLRNGEGRLITIPNSAIAIVENLSKEWARVDFAIDVAYHTNVDEALAVIKDLAEQLYRDPDWQEKIIEPPDVLGIDEIDHAGILIRVWIKVKPLQQWIVAREFRRRLKTKFDRSGISIGMPQQSLLFNNSLELLRSMPNGRYGEQPKSLQPDETP